MQNREARRNLGGRLCDEPERLFGIADPIIVDCDADVIRKELDRNPPHLVLGNEESLHRITGRLLELTADVFGFQDRGAWRWQRTFYGSLMRQFFDESSDAPAWLMVTPGQIAHEHRFGALAVRPAEGIGKIRPIAPERNLKRSKVDFGFGIGTIETTSLLVDYPRGSVTDRPYLVRQKRERLFLGECRVLESLDAILYFAHPEADESRVSKGHVPAISAHYDSLQKVLATVSLTLAKLPRGEGGDLTQLTVTFHPGDGWTAAFAPGRRSLETYLMQYPLDAYLLNEGVRRRDGT